MKNYTNRGGCYPPRQNPPRSICIILHILRKPNLIIVLLFFQLFKMLLSSEQDYLLIDLLQTFGLILGTVSKADVFPCRYMYTPQKIAEIHRAICLAYSCSSPVQIK